MQAHVPLRVGELPLRVAFTVIQYRPAQQRQLLESNAISTRQGQVRSDGEGGARPVLGDAFKGEDTDSVNFAKASKNA